MSRQGTHHDVAFGSLLDDIPTLDDVRLEGGFFAGVDRGEWIRNLEHHFRYGEELLMLWSEPGIGKSTLLTQLASRLDTSVYTVVTLDARRGGTAEHLWGALDRRLSLPHGAEGWEALKRTAKKLAASGQSLAIIVDHADKLNKEAVQLLRAMLDVHLPECRFVLALDGQGVSANGQWPHIEAQLFEKGQLARLWPFAEEDAMAYLDFRLHHAKLGDVILTDRQKQTLFARSEGNAGLIKAELQRMLTAGELLGVAGHSRKSGKPVKKSAAPKKAAAASPNLTPTAPKAVSRRKPVLPKAHTVAMSVLAVALLGFYIVWDQPVPSSVIQTPLPTAQLPPVIKTLDETLPVSTQMENYPPASGPAGPSSTHLQPPAGFMPSNVPLMAAQAKKPTEASSVNDPAVPAAASKSSPKPAALPSDAASAKPTAKRLDVPLDATTKIRLTKADQIPPNVQTAAASTAIAPPSTPEKTQVISPRSSVASSKATGTPVATAKPPATPKAMPPKTNPKAIVVAKAAPASASSKGAYTLQIMGLRDVRSVQAFMQRNAGVKGLRYYTTSLNGQPWYVIVQGEYPTRQAAQAAVRSLPAALQASNPFPKSLAALR